MSECGKTLIMDATKGATTITLPAARRPLIFGSASFTIPKGVSGVSINSGVINSKDVHGLCAGMKVKFIGGTKHKARLTLDQLYEVQQVNGDNVWVKNDAGTNKAYNRHYFVMPTPNEVDEEPVVAEPKFMDDLQNV